eukprot:4883222-Prymnesium_polylepis.2
MVFVRSRVSPQLGDGGRSPTRYPHLYTLALVVELIFRHVPGYRISVFASRGLVRTPRTTTSHATLGSRPAKPWQPPCRPIMAQASAVLAVKPHFACVTVISQSVQVILAEYYERLDAVF